jgi:hypothetical protein
MSIGIALIRRIDLLISRLKLSASNFRRRFSLIAFVYLIRASIIAVAGARPAVQSITLSISCRYLAHPINLTHFDSISTPSGVSIIRHRSSSTRIISFSHFNTTPTIAELYSILSPVDTYSVIIIWQLILSCTIQYRTYRRLENVWIRTLVNSVCPFIDRCLNRVQ